MSTNEEVLEEQICEMCGTTFFGTGGVCSTECSEAWVKTHIDGPWNQNQENGETNERD